MNMLLKQTFTATILATMVATAAQAAPAEAPPVFVKRVADVCSLKITEDEADELLGQAIEKTEIFLCDSSLIFLFIIYRI